MEILSSCLIRGGYLVDKWAKRLTNGELDHVCRVQLAFVLAFNGSLVYWIGIIDRRVAEAKGFRGQEAIMGSVGLARRRENLRGGMELSGE